MKFLKYIHSQPIGLRAQQNRRRALLYTLLTISLGFTGCASKSERAAEELYNTPAYRPLNVHTYEFMPAGIQRVVVLPAYYPGSNLQIQSSLDNSIKTQLNRFNLFEVVPVSTDTLYQLAGTSHASTIDRLPADFFSKITSRYAADGVIFTEITRYDPYQPITLGIRTSLVSTRTLETIWAFDDVFLAGDPRVTSGALKYEKLNGLIPYPQDTRGQILQSPSQFVSYVADTVFSTLPGRPNRLPPVEIGDTFRAPPSPVAIEREATPEEIVESEPEETEAETSSTEVTQHLPPSQANTYTPPQRPGPTLPHFVSP